MITMFPTNNIWYTKQYKWIGYAISNAIFQVALVVCDSVRYR